MRREEKKLYSFELLLNTFNPSIGLNKRNELKTTHTHAHVQLKVKNPVDFMGLLCFGSFLFFYFSFFRREKMFGFPVVIVDEQAITEYTCMYIYCLNC